MIDSLALCRQKLPLPDLWRTLGLHGEPRKSMRSPFREDSNNSFSVYESKGRWFFKDHNPAFSEHSGDEVTLIEVVRKVSNSEAIKVYHELAGVERKSERKGRGGEARKPGAAPAAPPRPPERKRRSDLKPDWSRMGEIAVIYDYHDAAGEVLHQTIRFAPKDFRQRRRPVEGETPADDGWVYFLEGIETVLFGLQEVLSALPEVPIFLVEGEKDALTLQSLGLVGTTVPMGAGKWRESYTKALRGKWVVVLGDNDEAGRKHVWRVCEALQGHAGRLAAVGTEEIWPGCPDGADVTDWLDFCKAEPAGLGLSESCTEEEVRAGVALRLREWAEVARTPEALRYRHCFGYGERGALKIYQDVLAEILVAEREVRFAGEVWWQYERSRWQMLEVQREPRRWIMEAMGAHEGVRREMTAGMVASIEDLMASRAAMHPDRFNSHDSELINVGNGMLGLRDWKLRPHAPKYLSTVQIPHRFDRGARCPLWSQWLEEMLPAEDSREQVQEIFGYCLAPGMNYHKFFFFYGDGGTGKSTCIDVLTHLVGEENAVAVRLQDLDNPFLRQQLVGKRLYLAPELDRDSFKHMGLVKAITSGDPIHVERKHKDGYSYRPQGRFIMASNVRATTSDTSDGFFRRLCQITWENQIPEERKDYGLLERFKGEMDGILAWSLLGLERLRERGRFEATKDGQRAQELLQMHRASAKAFFARCIEEVDDASVMVCTEELFEEYKKWCRWEHVKPHFEDDNYLSRELLNKFPHLREKRRRCEHGYGGEFRRRMCYTGMRLKRWDPEGEAE